MVFNEIRIFVYLLKICMFFVKYHLRQIMQCDKIQNNRREEFAMKRFIAVLSGLLVLPAFAEVAPVYYDDVIEYTDEDVVDDVVPQDADVAPVVYAPASTARANVVSSRTSARNAAGRVVTSPRGNVTQRAVASRVSTNSTRARTASDSVAPTRVVRSVSDSTRQIQNTRRAMQGAKPGVQARASIVQTDTVNTPLYSGRVAMRSSGNAVRARIPSVSTATTIATDSTAVATDVASIDELAQITDFCKAQYTQCMDNFCNVLDDTQGRCSCSKNLKNYEKTEQALQAANASLQDVAQQIQYIGLSADEVTSLFAQTEAELQMSKTNDNSQLKNDLDKIKSLIIDVKSGTASASDTSIGVDLSGLLSFDIDSAGFDLGSILGTSTTNTASINNQRGEQLYKTATARCKTTVLNNCAAQGVDVSIITGAYDLEIDKQCIVYERALTESNTNMSRTVRNAQNLLQRARLMVAKNKNQYDLLRCVNALDTCMRDDFVCGSEYEYCLDPTGKFIVNGEIVSGSLPGVSGGELTSEIGVGKGLYATWNYDQQYNAWGKGSITEYINKSSSDPNNMAVYLKSKIGSIDENGKSSGMCASVLNKCQNFTYTTKSGGKNTYDDNNQVIQNYLERTLIQIKSAQDKILADYAEECISDVNTCLSDNNYTYNRYSYNSTDAGTISNAAVQACLPIINTCQSVTEHDGETSNVEDWLQDALNVLTTTTSINMQNACADVNGTWTGQKCECQTKDLETNKTTSVTGTWEGDTWKFGESVECDNE